MNCHMRIDNAVIIENSDCCEKHNIKLFRAQKYIENPKIGQCCYGMKLEIMGLSSIQFGAILLWTFFVVAFFVVDFFFFFVVVFFVVDFVFLFHSFFISFSYRVISYHILESCHVTG